MKSGKDNPKWNNWQMSFFFHPRIPLIFFLSLPLSLSSGPLSIQTAAVFIWVKNHLSCIWHLDTVNGQRGEMRADDGERQLTISGDTHCSAPFPSLISSLYCILIGWLMYHGNSLWMQGKQREGDVEPVCTLVCPESQNTISEIVLLLEFTPPPSAHCL